MRNEVVFNNNFQQVVKQ